MLLKDKVAVITGGASGIGKATALKYAKEGARVVVADFNEDGATETVEQIKDLGGVAVAYKVDASKFAEVEALVDFTVKTYGTIHVMFNNAGIGSSNLINDFNEEMYQKVIAVNQHGVAYGIASASKKMIELGVKGTIINTASVYGYLANLGAFAYNASKGAVVMMTKTAALDLAPHGIRVVGVAPGFVNTPIIDGLKNKGLTDLYKNFQMRKEFIEPEDIAGMVCLLAMEEANVVNGSVVMLDDGLTGFKAHMY
ncbi:SDR family oxidoreductase [Peribacillus frigoritolerans]|uniref:SDR family NAD(P)-dependent oxidoreductase n=1 Tax=Peribacillus frigoritolerans TaxID=450367 RepID=UPI0021D1BF72|nr:SDR family oxidoreductase [Peribacillus frigoritolerans]MCU6599010.1 SDR family oxidoreductase [Peribacillus frigoritolerans]